MSKLIGNSIQWKAATLSSGWHQHLVADLAGITMPEFRDTRLWNYWVMQENPVVSSGEKVLAVNDIIVNIWDGRLGDVGEGARSKWTREITSLRLLSK